MSASWLEVVTSPKTPPAPCSAWLIISKAMNLALAVSSAIIIISLGPAGLSIATTFQTIIFAAVTYLLPGPMILSTLDIVSVP